MRFARFGIALLMCLSVAACASGSQTSAHPGGPSGEVGVVKLSGTPGPEDYGVSGLLKSPSLAAQTNPTPTPVATPEGPMSCVQQRLRALQQGKVLPTETCS